MTKVASFLTVDLELLKLFKEFIFKYKALQFDGEDDDTYVFKRKGSDKYELFYHHKNDVAFELSYNYSEDEVQALKTYFLDKQIYLVDITYRDQNFFWLLIRDFLKSLGRETVNVSSIVLHDPFEGLLIFGPNFETKKLAK